MNDRDRLIALLRSAMNEALERRAGLPRITIYDRPRPSRGKRRFRKRAAEPWQLRLPLYKGGKHANK